ncbi:MAG: PhzF family phenazine biosynthesis protein [Pseudomonadota bacterium]|nr:PhzF family phenazine biosynthesis protein [Pseudomonadota bacterium]
MPTTFDLVDVFGSGVFSGNPVAVVGRAEGIEESLLQRAAQWLNLSETTFLYEPSHPEADYRLRIFTLERELPFAGHPTLGSCHAWLAAGGQPRRGDRIVQECGAGLVTLRRSNGMLAFEAPPLIRSGEVDDADLAEVAAFLRLDLGQIVDARWVDNGPGWVAVMLASARDVLAIEPLARYHRRMDVGVVGAHAPGDEAAFEVRALFTDHHGNVVEDPVTGSLNASLAQWLYSTARVSGPYIAAQGTRLGRRGRVFIERDEDAKVWVGGRTRTMFTGRVGDW